MQRFLFLEHSLTRNGRFQQFHDVMREYLDLNAEAIPSQDMDKPSYEVFYLPVHAVYKKSSTKTHASAKSSSGVSLNDILLVPPLWLVWLRRVFKRKIAKGGEIEIAVCEGGGGGGAYMCQCICM